MYYNKFRIWIGRIFGVLLLIVAQGNFNWLALWIVGIGILIRIWAAGYIHKDKEVTMVGPYKFLRHPLYVGNFFVGLGFTLFINIWQLVVVYVPVFICIYYKKVKLEEQYLHNEFGLQYDNYKKITPPFLPDLTKVRQKDNVEFSWQNVIQNREHINLVGIIIIIVFFTTFVYYNCLR